MLELAGGPAVRGLRTPRVVAAGVWLQRASGARLCAPLAPCSPATHASPPTHLYSVSSAGKSTLVSLIQRLYDPTAGAVLLGGTDLRWALFHVGRDSLWQEAEGHAHGGLASCGPSPPSSCNAASAAARRHLHKCKACLPEHPCKASHPAPPSPSLPTSLPTRRRQLDAAWFRRRVGVVSQDPRLFGLTVAENIAYGCPEATQVGWGWPRAAGAGGEQHVCVSGCGHGRSGGSVAGQPATQHFFPLLRRRMWSARRRWPTRPTSSQHCHRCGVGAVTQQHASGLVLHAAQLLWGLPTVDLDLPTVCLPALPFPLG